MNEVKGISFDGGGYLTIMYIGALTYMINHTDFKTKNLEVIHGSSAGSIIGTCTALGINPHIMLKESLKINFKSLVLDEFNDEFSLQEYFLSNDKPFQGLAPGNKFIECISTIFQKNCSFWKDDLTFFQLFKISGIKLIITATDITNRVSKDFNYETDPGLPILLAIRMSCGIPIVFQPYKYMNNEYIDGDIFDKNMEFVNGFLPNKKMIRFVCKGEEKKGFIGLLSKIIFCQKKPRDKSYYESQNLFVFKHSGFFLKNDKSFLLSLYTEGIIQLKKQFNDYYPSLLID